MGQFSRRELLTRAAWLLAGGSVLRFAWDRPAGAAGVEPAGKEPSMKLPAAEVEGSTSLETAIEHRRTIRAFGSGQLSRQQWAQLLWSAQGITGPRGFKRAAPSAGALYPLDVYTVLGANAVPDTEPGVYHYEPRDHAVTPMAQGDLRLALARASLSQTWMADAQVSFVITAQYDRITGKYGRRGVRYAMIEAGHVGQNLFLQAEAMGLKAGIVGAFTDREVISVLGIPQAHEPLLIMPVGYG